MNREELFKSTKSILQPEIAQKQTFAIIGVGSGGARVAEEVVRFGVGHVFLIDLPGEVLKEHNIIRHPLGYSSLGQLKVEAMKRRLNDINPACDVRTFELDVTRDAAGLASIVSQCTQVMICTDNEPSKHAVNVAAVAAGVPLSFAGVFDGGCGGEVGRVLPGAACYACIASHLQRNSHEEETAETFDYTNPNSVVPQRASAALNIDIAQIALIQARVALLTMLGSEELEGNYILFGNRKVDGLFPRILHSEIWQIDAKENCLICGRRNVSEEASADELLAAAHASE